jgi:PadR family transcriptional regulator PadR
MEAYGLEVCGASGVGPGTAYAILRRLEDEGFLEGRWERLDARDAGRPPRRYYRLTPHGASAARRETESDADAVRRPAPGWVTP